jgi:hypothetical protein
VTDRVRVSQWLAAYETAWRAAGTEGLAGIFTDDASYLQSPYEEPVVGLPAIRAGAAAGSRNGLTGRENPAPPRADLRRG